MQPLKRTFSDTKLDSHFPGPKRVCEYNNNNLISSLFICVKEGQNTSAKLNLFNLLEQTSTEIRYSASNQEVVERCQQVIQAFQSINSEQRGQIAQWIGDNTFAGLGNDSMGAFPIIKDFIELIEKILQRKDLYSPIMKTLNNFSRSLKFLQIPQLASIKNCHNRCKLPEDINIVKTICSFLDDSQSLVFLMLTNKIHLSFQREILLAKSNLGCSLNEYNFKSLSGLTSVMDYRSAEFEQLQLSFFLKSKDINLLNSKYKSIKVLKIDRMIQKSFLHILKKHPSIHTLHLENPIDSLAFLNGWNLLKNITCRSYKLPIAIEKNISCLQSINIHLMQDKIDLNIFNICKELITLKVTAEAIQSLDALVNNTSLTSLTLKTTFLGEVQLPFYKSIKYLDISGYSLKSNLFPIDWLKWSSFEGTLITPTCRLKGKIIKGQLQGYVELKTPHAHIMGVFKDGVLEEGKISIIVLEYDDKELPAYMEDTRLPKERIVTTFEGKFEKLQCSGKKIDEHNVVTEGVFSIESYKWIRLEVSFLPFHI